MTYTSDPSKGNSQQIETQQTETQQTEPPPSSSTHPSASFINRKKRTPIVGLVGAAGCRHALEMLFRNLPEDSGMTFVISTRLGSRILNNLPAVLQRRTTMEVVIAADGATLQADHIYLAPAGVQMTIKQGKLSLQAPMAKRDSVDDEPDDDDATERAPNNAAANGQADEAMGVLDRFFVSLAQVQDQDFAAILLSGTGTDGVTGFKAVQEAGGLTLIQDPDEAAHGALPRRAMAACEKATVASAGELARRLIQAKGDLADGSAVVQTDTVESFDELYTAILEQVAMHTGHNLSHYKVSTMRRRIARRMSMTGVASLPQYIVLLQRNTAEAHALFQDALVSVTSFFRDPDAYDMLEQDCIPQLFAEKGGSDNVRVWVVGCATGQEAYSVAMQLVEYAAQVGEPPRLQVFATDLDEAAIAVARRGIYPRSI
ncbi:MAG: hypothetical protein KDE19_20775, partial [Caldilineaceae bacterium]|nr:hypothetical protein [Caldilineaceae bacterium]